VASGNHITWTRAKAAPTWEGYLSAVFTWAGTRSLQAYETLPDTTPEPGDLLVQGGSPGHAVLLLDVARRGPDTLLLVGEGFMPAQDFHVELGPEAGWSTCRAGASRRLTFADGGELKALTTGDGAWPPANQPPSTRKW
jgi:hypothetical protein